jgi:phytanoyl-CoA hydroxylase
VQIMFYFRPRGSRGQALHQDNFYLRAALGWRSTQPMQVVPVSHRWPVLCAIGQTR